MISYGRKNSQTNLGYRVHEVNKDKINKKNRKEKKGSYKTSKMSKNTVIWKKMVPLNM